MTVDRDVTAEEAAALLDVPRARIDEWKHRGRIVPSGYVRGRGPDAPLYRLEELRPLVEQWRRRTATRRRDR